MPPDVVAPDPVSLEGIVIVSVVVDGTDVTINFLSSKSDALKLDPVIVVKLSNNNISPSAMLCALEKVSVTTADPLVVLNAFVSVVVVLIGCMS
jgi:hypothetical protein